MSDLSNRHMAIIEALFEMSTGYVLNYSNTSFRDLILLNTNIDVYEDEKYLLASSKAKKFRVFLRQECNKAVGTVLIAMLDEREISVTRKIAEGVIESDQYSAFADEIKKKATSMLNENSPYESNAERLHADIARGYSVLKDLITIGEKLCCNQTYNKNSSENSMNDFFRDCLAIKGYTEVKDQSRHGISMNGKDAGEVDLLIGENGKEVAIIEGLKLESVSTGYIAMHLEKSIINYNALGTPTFLLAYVSTGDFKSFWNRYVRFIEDYKFSSGITVESSIKEQIQPNASTQVAEMVISRDGFSFPVFFIALKL